MGCDMSGVIVVLLQFAAICLFIGGGIYFFDGFPRENAARLPLVVAAAVSVLLLLAMAEIVNILNSTRNAAERSATALERVARSRSEATKNTKQP